MAGHSYRPLTLQLGGPAPHIQAARRLARNCTPFARCLATYLSAGCRAIAGDAFWQHTASSLRNLACDFIALTSLQGCLTGKCHEPQWTAVRGSPSLRARRRTQYCAPGSSPDMAGACACLLAALVCMDRLGRHKIA